MLQQEGWFQWFHQLFRIYCIEEIYQLKWTPCGGIFFGSLEDQFLVDTDVQTYEQGVFFCKWWARHQTHQPQRDSAKRSGHVNLKKKGFCIKTSTKTPSWRNFYFPPGADLQQAVISLRSGEWRLFRGRGWWDLDGFGEFLSVRSISLREALPNWLASYKRFPSKNWWMVRVSFLFQENRLLPPKRAQDPGINQNGSSHPKFGESLVLSSSPNGRNKSWSWIGVTVDFPTGSNNKSTTSIYFLWNLASDSDMKRAVASVITYHEAEKRYDMMG